MDNNKDKKNYNVFGYAEICLLVLFILETLFALYYKSVSYPNSELTALFWIIIFGHSFLTVYYIIYLIETFKVKNKILQILDCILCFFLCGYSIFPFGAYLYEKSPIEYFITGVCFSLMPVIICLFEKLKINIDIFLRIILRIFMVLAVVLLIIAIPSCSMGSTFG